MCVGAVVVEASSQLPEVLPEIIVVSIFKLKVYPKNVPKNF